MVLVHRHRAAPLRSDRRWARERSPATCDAAGPGRHGYEGDQRNPFARELVNDPWPSRWRTIQTRRRDPDSWGAVRRSEHALVRRLGHEPGLPLGLPSHDVYHSVEWVTSHRGEERVAGRFGGPRTQILPQRMHRTIRIRMMGRSSRAMARYWGYFRRNSRTAFRWVSSSVRMSALPWMMMWASRDQSSSS